MVLYFESREHLCDTLGGLVNTEPTESGINVLSVGERVEFRAHERVCILRDITGQLTLQSWEWDWCRRIKLMEHGICIRLMVYGLDVWDMDCTYETWDIPVEIGSLTMELNQQFGGPSKEFRRVLSI